MVKVKYSSPAYPPYGIKVNKTYSLEKTPEGYVLIDVKNKVVMELDDIKILFTPIDKTWDEVFKTSKSVKKEEKVSD